MSFAPSPGRADYADMLTVVDDVLELLQTRGHAAYGGEAVSQREHALQTAMLAEAAGAPAALITAALLHDIGHLVEDDSSAARDNDAYHEQLGANYLRRAFSAEVTEPIALHVPAKRYLCAVEPEYRAGLSPMSEHTLILQGGPMTEAEVMEFRTSPFASAALALRRWDDQAKVPGMRLVEILHYRPILEAVVMA